MTECTCLRFAVCKISISLGSVAPVSGAVEPEGMAQRERKVSTFKAQSETVTAVGNTLSQRA